MRWAWMLVYSADTFWISWNMNRDSFYEIEIGSAIIFHSNMLSDDLL